MVKLSLNSTFDQTAAVAAYKKILFNIFIIHNS